MWIIWALFFLFLFLGLVFFALVTWGTLRFQPIQAVPVFSDSSAAPIPQGYPLKVMSWNVQYMAGKNHVFWYDLQHNQGPDSRPTSAELAQTLVQVAHVIQEQNPDIILLQEVDDGCQRSDLHDQLAQLRQQLPAPYAHHASAFYWQARFAPHPRIMGPVGMKLSVLSKYPIASAKRHALADVPRPFFLQAFNIRRAMLEVRLPIQGGGELAVVNTHLEAFVYGHPVMAQQTAQLDQLLQSLNQQNIPWIAGGDFNLLPPGEYLQIQEKERWLYNPQSEMELLYKNHHVLPNYEQATGPNKKNYWTHFPNRPWAYGPDRVIDYLMYSPQLTPTHYQVIQQNTLEISDHLPVVAQFTWPTP